MYSPCKLHLLRMSGKRKNKLVHALTGNIYKFAHWKLESAVLPNRMEEIEIVLKRDKPHVLGISEANFLG